MKCIWMTFAVKLASCSYFQFPRLFSLGTFSHEGPTKKQVIAYSNDCFSWFKVGIVRVRADRWWDYYVAALSSLLKFPSLTSRGIILVDALARARACVYVGRGGGCGRVCGDPWVSLGITVRASDVGYWALGGQESISLGCKPALWAEYDDACLRDSEMHGN